MVYSMDSNNPLNPEVLSACHSLPQQQQAASPNDGRALRPGPPEGDMASVERDEKRLAELGRGTVEMFVVSHIITESLEVRRFRRRR